MRSDETFVATEASQKDIEQHLGGTREQGGAGSGPEAKRQGAAAHSYARRSSQAGQEPEEQEQENDTGSVAPQLTLVRRN